MSNIKNLKGYKLDFTSNTMVMNYKFAAAAEEYGSDEYNLMKQIQKDFPNMSIVVRSGREQVTPRKNKRLTYENMKKHISVYENAQELLDMFESVKALSATVASPYKYVSDWFVKQFPDYGKTPSLKDGKIITLPVDPPKVEEYKVKKGA